jgi:hypothetical protein
MGNTTSIEGLAGSAEVSDLPGDNLLMAAA